MEDGWDFSRLVREAPFHIVGLLGFFSHLYKSHTLLIGVWYGGSATSWDWDGFVEGSIRAVDSRGRLGSASIWSAQSPRWEKIEGSRTCPRISEEDGPRFQKASQVQTITDRWPSLESHQMIYERS